MAYEIIKLSGVQKWNEAIVLNDCYISKIDNEISNAREAIDNVYYLLKIGESSNINMLRNEVSKKYNISIDTLRNWEMNGLLKTKRKQNGYRVYNSSDIKRIQIIRYQLYLE